MTEKDLPAFEPASGLEKFVDLVKRLDRADAVLLLQQAFGAAQLHGINAYMRLTHTAPELAEACKLFTEAAREVVELVNGKGIACPASIALAAEKARNALALAGKPIEQRTPPDSTLLDFVQQGRPS